MYTDLRKSPERSMGRYWVALSDAAAFRHLLSTLALAEDLRRDLAEELQLLALLDAPKLTVLLLTVAETAWGKGKAASLVAQIIDLKKEDDMRRSRAHKLIRATVQKMPVILWPADKAALRRELLDELDRTPVASPAAMLVKASKVDKREIDWRAALDSNLRASRATQK